MGGLQAENDLILKLKQGLTKLMGGLEGQKWGAYHWNTEFKGPLQELCSKSQNSVAAATSLHTYETDD